MSPRRLVAWGALLVVAVAHPTNLSSVAADAADALSEVAMKAFEGMEAMPPQGDASFSADSDDSDASPGRQLPAIKLSTAKITKATSNRSSLVTRLRDLVAKKVRPHGSHTGASAAATPAAPGGSVVSAYGVAAQPGPLALRKMRRDVASNVAQNEVLMNILRRGAEAADKAGEADAVVFSLARAVHSWVLESAAGRDSVYERPAALAALHQWDAVGPFAGPTRLVDASEVRGVALLLGRPGQKAVDGAAAFAFRAVEDVSREIGRFAQDRSSLELAVADALNALEAPATSCHNLLLGSVEDTHAAVQAASSEMEWSVCQFVVKAYAALQAAVSSQGSVSFDSFAAESLRVSFDVAAAAALLNASDGLSFDNVAAETLAAALNNASEIEVGPVLGGGPAQRAVASPAGMAAVGRPVAAVLRFAFLSLSCSKIWFLTTTGGAALKQARIKSFGELLEAARNALERAEDGKRNVQYHENELKKEKEKPSLRRTKRHHLFEKPTPGVD